MRFDVEIADPRHGNLTAGLRLGLGENVFPELIFFGIFDHPMVLTQHGLLHALTPWNPGSEDGESS